MKDKTPEKAAAMTAAAAAAETMTTEKEKRSPEFNSVNVTYGMRFEDEEQLIDFFGDMSDEMAYRINKINPTMFHLTLKVLVRSGERYYKRVKGLLDEAPMEQDGGDEASKKNGHGENGFTDFDFDGFEDDGIPKTARYLTAVLRDITNEKEAITENCIKLYKRLHVEAQDVCGVGLMARHIKYDNKKIISPHKMLIEDFFNQTNKKSIGGREFRDVPTQTVSNGTATTVEAACSTIELPAKSSVRQRLNFDLPMTDNAPTAAERRIPRPVLNNSAYDSIMPSTVEQLDEEVLRSLPHSLQLEVMNSFRNISIDQQQQQQQQPINYAGKGAISKKRKVGPAEKVCGPLDRMFGLRSDPGASSSKAADERLMPVSKRFAASSSADPYDVDLDEEMLSGNDGTLALQDNALFGPVIDPEPNANNTNGIAQPVVSRPSDEELAEATGFLERALAVPQRVLVDMRDKAHLCDEVSVDKCKAILREWIDKEKEMSMDDMVYLEKFFCRLARERNWINLIALTDCYYELMLKKFEQFWIEAYNSVIATLREELYAMDNVPTHLFDQLHTLDIFDK